MSTITHITSSKQLSTLLSANNGKLAVIDFHATWCGPCHAIAPRYEALSKQYTDALFLKCDVDACRDVARDYMITAMPTFVFLKNGQKVATVRGADVRGIETALRQHSLPSSGTAFSGKGQTLGGPDASPTAAPDTASSQAPDPWAWFNNLDPQVRLFGGLIAAYLVFWWFFSPKS
ncbi:thioredoxin-domain-containing protein [Dacryopinax primogenitus]|uniref:Thioredoxin-domain-containing protein n=1 Tax=Dacryopinax primogenitus (strain DJM 731) TaxID=1858805 RepID=M5G1H0_DACPD|nr:thioredoxin-domain-containing protein [Dacryopinax primogenitus]EJU02574.1 thioredoxin-domain-containing protein [Dacryopinax primogenitus]